MKKLIIVLAIASAVCLFAGCASHLNGRANYTWYNTSVTVNLRGEETSTVWLGLFGTQTYPAAEKVAKDNGINKIATVERYSKPGILGLWTDYTTIVTGEGPGKK